MSDSAKGPVPCPTGYVSGEAKRQYTIIAGVLGVLFFLGQIAIPFVVMFPLMFIVMNEEMAGGFRVVQADRGAYWDGKLWYVEETMAAGPTPRQAMRFDYSPRILRWLKCFAPGQDQQPARAAALQVERPWLLAAPDRLWIISGGQVACFRGGKLDTVAEVPVGDLSRPFLMGDRPAAIEHRPDGCFLRVLDDGQWKETARLRLAPPGGAAPGADDVRVLALDGAVHLFLRSGNTLYYRQGLPEEGASGDDWQVVHEVGSAWATAVIGGRPAVFLRQDAAKQGELIGMRLDGGRWQPFFSRRAHSFLEGGKPDQPASRARRRDMGGPSIGAYPTGGDRFLLLLSLNLGGARLVEVDGGKIQQETRLERGFAFPSRLMSFMFLPYLLMLGVPLVLAFVLSLLMAKYRAPSYAAEGREAPYASLWRRAMAEVVDAVILGWPFAGAFLAMLPMFSDMEGFFENAESNPLWFFVPFLFACLAGPWALLVLLGFSFTEGRWGATPGKWLCGIRVMGTDLRPCGFGRALVRNLLKFVDGFFNFLVGILLVALTENRQRLGDLAARTVVVTARAGSRPR
jgi:uncharacterized RDD family membrane protein YckC